MATMRAKRRAKKLAQIEVEEAAKAASFAPYQGLTGQALYAAQKADREAFEEACRVSREKTDKVLRESLGRPQADPCLPHRPAAPPVAEAGPRILNG